MLHFLEQFYPLIFVWISGMVALVSYRKSWPASFKWLALSIMLIVLVDTAASLLANKSKSTHLLYNIFFVINFLAIAYFLKSILEFPVLGRLIKLFYFVFPTFAIINGLFIQGYENFNTYTFVVGGVFILVLAIAYLWQLYISEQTENIFRDPVFWFCLAWLVYFSVAVPYLGMFTYLLKQLPKFTKNYFRDIFLVTIILYNIGITVGFICKRISMK